MPTVEQQEKMEMTLAKIETLRQIQNKTAVELGTLSGAIVDSGLNEGL
jgi:hypothetical protein